ncbi:hypothetical protein M514_22852 [Trichuris suis]|uniref:Uncharacterized protein n=1 Tax=Trichuris suis TaxID=68888 RepID=A0A085N6A7_9BILA|nr:hypothetical protein M514_22852 [Trichuris suis]
MERLVFQRRTGKVNAKQPLQQPEERKRTSASNGVLSKGRTISHLSMDSFVEQVPFLLHRGEYVSE